MRGGGGRRAGGRWVGVGWVGASGSAWWDEGGRRCSRLQLPSRLPSHLKEYSLLTDRVRAKQHECARRRLQQTACVDDVLDNCGLGGEAVLRLEVGGVEVEEIDAAPG